MVVVVVRVIVMLIMMIMIICSTFTFYMERGFFTVSLACYILNYLVSSVTDLKHVCAAQNAECWTAADGQLWPLLCSRLNSGLLWSSIDHRHLFLVPKS